MTANDGHHGETQELSIIIADTTEAMFEMAGGFAYVDEIAIGLNARWRKQEHGPVVVSATDLAWLLDGYARSRLTDNGRQP